MSDSRATYATHPAMTPQDAVNNHADREDAAEREFLLAMLRGLTMQAKSLADQRAGVLQQAKAIRQRLGLEESP